MTTTAIICHGGSIAVVFAADRSHSQLEVLNPRLFAFFDTARLSWSVAPFGKSAVISTVSLNSA